MYIEDDKLKRFLLELAETEHGVSTSIIAGLLAKTLRFEADKSVKILGVASLFHDVGLMGMPEKFLAENPVFSNESERALYETHPKEGAELLQGIHGIDPVILQAVAQHHLRRNNTGFPRVPHGGSINMVSQVVGLSEAFAHIIKNCSADRSLDPWREMEHSVLAGFSHEVAKAFRDAFIPLPSTD